ncbi:MAG TPA: DUF2339 domain-containing protein [Terriglobales bacterium]|nr:DUF2339 domain-containing protein [Terriglobales bacterium]
MADKPQRDNGARFEELVRAVRDLTVRMQRLERQFENELAHTTETPLREPAHVPGPNSSVSRGGSLESHIGSQWLNRVGVVAILVGVSYLLRYAFVSEWISAGARVWLGVCAGIGVILISEWFRARGYRVLSLSIKAIGIGVIYLSLWAGFQLYQVLSGPKTFLGLVALTVLTGVLAFREYAEILATLALIGAFTTPLLISIPSREGHLFLYLAILDCATVTVTLLRGWSKLLAVSFLGTVLLYMVWYFERYRQAELVLTITAATVFFVLFCVGTTWIRPAASRGALWIRPVLGVANPALYFIGLYLLLHHLSRGALALAALGLSALYFRFAWKAQHSASFGATSLMPVYGGLGISFVAIAVALLVEVQWLSLGWFLTAAFVMAIGFWQDLSWLRWGALLLMCVAIVKAFVYDIWRLGLGYRTISFIGLGALLLVISFAYQRHGFSLVSKIGKDPTSRLR